MCLRLLLLLGGIFGAAFAQKISPGTWAVDTEPTNKMDIKGMTFFHEKKQADVKSEEKSHKTQQILNGNSKALYAFSQFMPDQSKLSLAAGLSRAVNKSRMNLDSMIPEKNNLLNYAPKAEPKAPFTSEVVGLDSSTNQLLNTGSKWNTDSFSGNDVVANDNSQLINFSQLGIMNKNSEDLINSVNDVKEISYFNTGTNGIEVNNKLDNSGNMQNNFIADNTRNNNAEVELNSFPVFNDNGYIFDNAFNSAETTKVDKSAQLENRVVTEVLPNEGIEPLANSVSRNAVNSFDSAVTSNTVKPSNGRKTIVNPFPFGQLQGNPEKIDKRLPTLEAKNDFIDNSRKPILKVKSAFIDMSGRQNPKMKTFGRFIDKSKEMTSNTSIKPTEIPTTPLTSTTKTLTASSIRTNPTISSPDQTSSNPVLTGLGLPGVASVNTNQTNQNESRRNNKSIVNKANTGSNTKSQNTLRTNTGNSATVLPLEEPSQGDLKVDMLYPPAPFPAIGQSHTIPDIDKTGLTKTTINTVDVESNADNELTQLKNGESLDIVKSDAVSVNNNKVTVDDLNYDYDMYADVSSDVNSNPSRNDQSTNNKQHKQSTSSTVPLVRNSNGDIDHFITEPSVQVINPKSNNNFQIHPNNQNIRSQTEIEGTGQINNFQNNIPNAVSNDRFGEINSNTIQNNGLAIQNNIQNRQINNQNTLHNGQQVGNSQLSNFQGIQGNIANSRFGNIGNNQNILNQNSLNSNTPTRLQQNTNMFQDRRILANVNSFQNEFTNQDVEHNLSSGLNKVQNSLNANTAVLNGQNEVLQQNGDIQTGRTNINNAPISQNDESFPWQSSINNGQARKSTGFFPRQSNVSNGPAGQTSGAFPGQSNANSGPVVQNGGFLSGQNMMNNELARQNSGSSLGQNNVNSGLAGQRVGLFPRQRKVNNGPAGQRGGIFPGQINVNNGIAVQNRRSFTAQSDTSSGVIGQDHGSFQMLNNANNIPVGTELNNPSTAGSTPNIFVNPNSNQRVETQVQNIGGNQNNRNVFPGIPSQGQNIQAFNGQVIAGQTDNFGTSIPNANFANQINNQANLNGINAQDQRNFNNFNVQRGIQNGDMRMNNINMVGNNFQNNPIVSNNINSQTPVMTNLPDNFNNLPRNTNGLANTERTVQNMASPFQNRNSLINSQSTADQRNIFNLGNAIQRSGQINGNVLQNRQSQNFGTFPNNVRNVPRTIPTLQGNVPLFQNSLPNNIINGNIRNGLNNFGQNMAANIANSPGVNRFPGNMPLNTNIFGQNAINRRFGTFR